MLILDFAMHVWHKYRFPNMTIRPVLSMMAKFTTDDTLKYFFSYFLQKIDFDLEGQSLFSGERSVDFLRKLGKISSIGRLLS